MTDWRSCTCGHPELAHHIPPGKTHRTWCTTANPTPCRCNRYTPTEEA